MIALYSRIKIKYSYHFKLPNKCGRMQKKVLHMFNKFLVLDVCLRLSKAENDITIGSQYI